VADHNKKKIFITGIAGFLGSHLAQHLVKNGYEVSGCDSLISGYRENVPKGAKFFKADCLDIKVMNNLIKGMDIVYHCACEAYLGVSVFSPHFVTQNTYGITTSVLSASISNKVKRFVFCSSMDRYGEQKIVPFTEDMNPNPKDPYGIAKYASELTIKNLSGYHGMEYVIVVPHNIIGPKQKYDDPYRNVASIMINLMLQGRQPVIYGDGEQKRSFSFVDDVVDPLWRCGFSDKVVGEIINVGPEREFVTINELAKTIAGLLDFDLKPIYLPGRVGEVKYANCSAEKARNLLGFNPATNLTDGLRSIIKYIKDKGTKPFKYHFDLEIVNDLTPKTWKDRLF
jgi:UDP-glucose 4-epimerase